MGHGRWATLDPNIGAESACRDTVTISNKGSVLCDLKYETAKRCNIRVTSFIDPSTCSLSEKREMDGALAMWDKEELGSVSG